MPDKMTREIEEILAKLDKEPSNGSGDGPRGGDRTPISLAQKRRQRHSPVAKSRRAAGSFADRITPASLLFIGAGVMVGGLVLSSAWHMAIWVSLGGVALFIGAFLWSLVRRPRAEGSASPAPRGVYWRDRYIEYEPANGGPWERLKRKLRR